MSRRMFSVGGPVLPAWCGPRVLVLGCLLALGAGCSDRSADDDTGETSPGAQPPPAAAAGAGGAGGAGGAAGSLPVSGASGQTGAGPSPGGGAAQLACSKGHLAYQGTVDEVPVLFGGKTHGGLTSTSKTWWLARSAPPSQIHAFGAGSLTDQPLLAASEVFLQGGWQGASGAWYCSPGGAFDGGGKPGGIPLDYTFTLSSLRRLGTCPGVPVEGSVKGCVDASKSGDPTCAGESTVLDGSIDGLPIATTPGGVVDNVDGTPGALFLFDGKRSVLGVSSVDGVTSGFILRHDAATDRRTLYCLGEGTTFSLEGGETRVSVPSLSRLGTCADAPPAAGSLHGCF